MFTGIVEETGRIRDVKATDDGRRLTIEGEVVTESLECGQSVSVNGVCLTVERFGRVTGEPVDGDGIDASRSSEGDRGWFEVFLAQETVDRTYLADLDVGDVVNLERAMAADGRFDGHLVQGHVDGTGRVTAVERVGEDWRFEFALPDELGRYVVEKGSIAVDGVSLTVASLDSERFSVAIIPATYEGTNLSAKSVGDPVHLEVDVLAKYVERMLADGFDESG